ncbi:MAG: tRNA-intron lyase [Candidatus Bathyarchaeia archaeon]
MNNTKDASLSSELKVTGTITEKGVSITTQSNIDALSQRGYGTMENGNFILTFYEALYLIDKEILKVKDKKENTIDFQSLLRLYEKLDENAWVKYLVYRDLRSRGYVAREGFGTGIDFRIYERGVYGKDTAMYLVMSLQEGKPVQIGKLTNIMLQCQSQKKELVLAVMNRRGEVVYYSVAPLAFK